VYWTSAGEKCLGGGKTFITVSQEIARLREFFLEGVWYYVVEMYQRDGLQRC